MMRKQPEVPDSRYTITHEYCGKPSKRYVARFLGEWLGQSYNRIDAELMAFEHHTEGKK
jgi:hypothetical protein